MSPTGSSPAPMEQTDAPPLPPALPATREGGGHAATPDYRYSHFRRGEDYDAELADEPLAVYFMEYEAQLVTALARRLFPAGIPRYLDFACGTGRITRLLEGLASHSCGVDISPGMLDLARRRCPRTTFLEADITRQALALEPVQLATAFRFFGNAQQELREGVLRALSGLVAPGGYLILNNHRNPACIRCRLMRLAGRPLPDYHGRVVDLHPGIMRRLLAENGFKLIESHGIGLWVVRAAMERTSLLRSRWARLLEPLSKLPLMASLCPDAVLVARRMAP